MSRAGDRATLERQGFAEVSAATADVAASDDERRHIVGLLASVDREARVSQRKLALELGVALGLVNTYVKRCVKKGLIKVRQIPRRRYAYYLTPKGFAEKSRLTAAYLTSSLTFFRDARMDCAIVLEQARRLGWTRIGFVGGSDLAEIAILSAAEQGATVVGLVDAGIARANVFGVPVFAVVEAMKPRPDGWIVTVINDAQGTYDALVEQEGARRVLAPALLSVRLKPREGA